MTYASGGAFSKYSHEFQTFAESGEDIVYLVPGTNVAINKEIIGDKAALRDIVPDYKDGMEQSFETRKSIEVGNIFKLGQRFSKSCNLRYNDENGQPQHPLMGCYGLGSSRVMGAIVECLADDNGLIWPAEIAPYKIHLVSLAKSDEDIAQAEQIYQTLTNAGIEVLYDDRGDIRAGQKFVESDLLGIPHRLVISSKTLKDNTAEYKHRTADDVEFIKIADLVGRFL
jgi:prolyl-tRNA synthetase